MQYTTSSKQTNEPKRATFNDRPKLARPCARRSLRAQKPSVEEEQHVPSFLEKEGLAI